MRRGDTHRVDIASQPRPRCGVLLRPSPGKIGRGLIYCFEVLECPTGADSSPDRLWLHLEVPVTVSTLRVVPESWLRTM